MEVDHVVKDYMKIAYRDGGILYVRATGFDVIQKYAAADARKPKLNKLGTQEWEKTKTKVKTAVSEVAKELVELYAVRANKEGHHMIPFHLLNALVNSQAMAFMNHIIPYL